jgi:hypothetical protein
MNALSTVATLNKIFTVVALGLNLQLLFSLFFCFFYFPISMKTTGTYNLSAENLFTEYDG